jgi:hypothetical protein
MTLWVTHDQSEANFDHTAAAESRVSVLMTLIVVLFIDRIVGLLSIRFG